MLQELAVCGRILIAFFGVLFGLFGAALTILGIAFLSQLSFMNIMLSAMTEYLKENGFQVCFTFAGIEVHLEHFATAFGAVLLSVGLFYLITGCCGCIGGCCNPLWSLATYIALYGLAEVVGIILVIVAYVKVGQDPKGLSAEVQQGTTMVCYGVTSQIMHEPAVLGTLVGLPLLGALLITFASIAMVQKARYDQKIHPI